MSNYESDPTKQLTAYASFDPALDREAMGADFVRHFGCIGERISDGRYGSRDPALVKTLPGQAACKFVLRPIRAFERASCDALPTAESRWLSALQYALVSCELHAPLSARDESYLPLPRDARLSLDALDWIAERVGIETLYEIGAVAYSRSRLGPFGRGFAPLPATSAHVQELLRLSRADTPTPDASGTLTTAAAST